MRRVVLTCLLVRVFIALVTSTFFQPDEYYQSLEPAHQLVFGYGFLTWEWLSPFPIRSIAYPALNIPIYWAIKQAAQFKIIRSTTVEDILIVFAPRLLHGALAALTDIYVYRLANKLLGHVYAQTTLCLSLTSAFHALALSRSLSNSLETSLTVMALYYLHEPGRRSRQSALICAGMACMMRPTNAVICLYAFSYALWTLQVGARLRMLMDAAIIGTMISGLLCTMDTLYYKKVTFTPLQFLRTNLSPVSSFYGSNPWHFYLSQAVPIVCTSCLPFVLHGAWLVLKTSHSRLRPMLGLTAWTIGAYSLAAHKEWRFIHPILPFLHIIAAFSIAQRFPGLPVSYIMRKLWWVIVPLLPIIAFVGLSYHATPIRVMYFLQSLPRSEVITGGIGLLMPCHSTPGQAYLHRQIADGKIWALGCEPPIGIPSVGYQDQTDVFFSSPLRYLERHFPANVDDRFPPSSRPATVPGTVGPRLLEHNWSHEWPLHLVMFGSLLNMPGVHDFLAHKGYVLLWENKGMGPVDDWRRQGGVVVLKWLNTTKA